MQVHKLHECTNIDKQLVQFRGHRKLFQYIPTKPAKYEIKYFDLAKAISPYRLRGQLYTGKAPGNPQCERENSFGSGNAL